MIHFNARSLYTSFNEIENFRKLLQFDIIAISETWLNKDTTLYYNFDCYDAFSVVRENKRGGGVAIYIKNKLNGRIYETKSMVIDDVLECVCVGFRINRNKTALVNCAYRCPGSNLLCFCDTMERLICRFSKKDTIFI